VLEPLPIDAEGDVREIVGAPEALEVHGRLLARVTIVLVGAGHERVGEGTVARARRQRAEVGDAPAYGRHAMLADAAEGGLETDDAAERRWIANGAAAVGAERDGREAGSDGRARPR